MKLRLYGDSIRLRLSPADVEMLRRNGEVLEVSHFGGSSCIEYGLKTNDDLKLVRASFENGKLLVELPRAHAEHWTETDEVGISHRQELAGGGWLKILIEKDFECLHSEDDESQEAENMVLFPNPRHS
jgi:hypothetical protein